MLFLINFNSKILKKEKLWNFQDEKDHGFLFGSDCVEWIYCCKSRKNRVMHVQAQIHIYIKSLEWYQLTAILFLKAKS